MFCAFWIYHYVDLEDTGLESSADMEEMHSTIREEDVDERVKRLARLEPSGRMNSGLSMKSTT